MNAITGILQAIGDGDKNASEKLLPLVYDELRQLANKKMANESPGHTLDATSLVHEAFLRVMDSSNPPKWETVGHFYCAAAESMRRILIDIARRKKSSKHGGDYKRVDMATAGIAMADESESWANSLVELDQALIDFSADYPKIAELVKLRYFTGLSMEKIAKVLGISRRSAQRNWTFARAWLFRKVTV